MMRAERRDSRPQRDSADEGVSYDESQ